MNEGQRRYAFEQYNLAKVRRGESFEPPIPGNNGHGNADEHPDIDELLAGGTEASEDAQRQAVEDFDEGLLEGDNQSVRSEPNNQGNPGPSGTRMTDMNAQPLHTPTGVKRRLYDSPSSSGITPGGSRTSADAKSKLPGTAADQGAGGGGEQAGPREVALPHPRSGIHSYVRYFSKMHKCLTYGIAYNNIVVQLSPGPPVINNYFISTPLAEIPWNWLFWYLNDSEYSLLPPGSGVISCQIRIRQRNVRVAFPVNATDNNLATLNQNKDIIYARGLNKKVDILPVQYSSFQSDQPMIPTGLNNWNIGIYGNLHDEMYGTAANISTVVPRHQMGIPMQLPVYAAVTYQHPETSYQDGYECLQEHYVDLDADASTGTQFFEARYHPQVGICTNPIPNIVRKFRANDLYVERGSHILQSQTTTVNFSADYNSVVGTSDATQSANSPVTSLTSTLQLIEKAQLFHNGLFNRNTPVVQDSVHIGVQPTLALTTANLITDQSNSSFTDTQAYFEIEADIEINTKYPTHRPLTTNANQKEGAFWEAVQNPWDYSLPLLDGLGVHT